MLCLVPRKNSLSNVYPPPSFQNLFQPIATCLVTFVTLSQQKYSLTPEFCLLYGLVDGVSAHGRGAEMKGSLKSFPTQNPFWDSVNLPVPQSNPDAENLPQSLHRALGGTKAPGAGLKRGWIPNLPHVCLQGQHSPTPSVPGGCGGSPHPPAALPRLSLPCTISPISSDTWL